MALNQFTRLQNVTIFQDFSWPAGLQDFKRYNLIYGWNGTGKTTLSRILRALETRTKPPTGTVRLKISGHIVDGADFPMSTLPIRVFNRDYVDENVAPAMKVGERVRGIYVLGKDSIDKQNQAEKLRLDIEALVKQHAESNEKAGAADKELDDLCIEKARQTKDILRPNGANPYMNYDKADFRKRYKSIALRELKTPLSSETRAQYISLLPATMKPSLEVPRRLPDLASVGAGAKALLGRIATSEKVPGLEDGTDLAEWVNQGLGLHQQHGSASCLFCTSAISAGRLKRLTAHFSDSYANLIRDLDREILKFEGLKNQLRIPLPKPAELYDAQAVEYSTALAKLSTHREAAIRYLDRVAQRLHEKRKTPSAVVTPEFGDVPTDAGELDAINSLIAAHNETTANFQSSIKSAREALVDDVAIEALSKCESLAERARQAREECARLVRLIVEKRTEMKEIEKELFAHGRSAELLNEDLVKYLGHDELQFEAVADGYLLKRRGAPADRLSEGEQTAIALLYFLASLNDRAFGPIGNGVIVLDDPVSSLDQTRLYAAFAFIRSKTLEAKQVVILAHNFTFFRCVRQWLLKVPKAERAMYLLESCEHGGVRSAVICPMDKLLVQFQSDYHYLYARVMHWTKFPAGTELATFYDAPNAARRLLEAFLAFRAPGDKKLIDRMRDGFPNAEETKLSRVYRFLNMHSHLDSIGEYDEDQTSLAECPAVLVDMLALMQQADSAHCDAMAALVASTR